MHGDTHHLRTALRNRARHQIQHYDNTTLKMITFYIAKTHSVYIPLLCKCLPLSVQLELRYVKFFMQGLQSKNYTFCFMTRQSSIHIDSTGSNCKHILHKYNLSCSSMQKCTYTAIYKTIVTTSSQLVDAHDRVCASIMDECIQIRDRSMLCDVISSHNASEIVNCLAVA